MSPVPPTAHSQVTVSQRIAAFVVGCLVLAFLLVAAVQNWIPAEFIGPIVRLSIAVAGAGFAGFLFGYFDWNMPNGVKAGGTIGIFVFLLLWNPGSKAVPLLNKNFDSCKNNVLAGHADMAMNYCRQAMTELPDYYEPVFWLAQAQYDSGSFASAIASFERATELGADLARTYYGLALSNSRLGRFDEAISVAKKALALPAATESLRARLQYLIADAEKSLWKFGLEDDSHFTNARNAFHAFIEIGDPKFKAQAELACILAVKAEATAVGEAKKSLEQEALQRFSEALASIKRYDSGRNALAEKSAFVNAYQADSGRCGAALSGLWAKTESTSYADTLKAVLAVS